MAIRVTGRAAHPIVVCCQRCGLAFYRPPIPLPGRLVFCSDACQRSTAPLLYGPDPSVAQLNALKAKYGRQLAQRYPQPYSGGVATQTVLVNGQGYRPYPIRYGETLR